MKIVPGDSASAKAMRVYLPIQYDADFRDYTMSDLILDRIASRSPRLGKARALQFRARGSTDHKEAWLTLVDRDTTGWSSALPLTADWQEFTLPLRELKIGRSLKLPHGYPEMWWDYWCEPAVGRAGPGDRLQLDQVERIQISHRQSGSTPFTGENPWIEIGTVKLIFD